MEEAKSVSSLYVVRYRHNGELIDVSSRGENGSDAFLHYLDRLRSWGKNPKEYKFISARRIETLEDQPGH